MYVNYNNNDNNNDNTVTLTLIDAVSIYISNLDCVICFCLITFTGVMKKSEKVSVHIYSHGKELVK